MCDMYLVPMYLVPTKEAGFHVTSVIEPQYLDNIPIVPKYPSTYLVPKYLNLVRVPLGKGYFYRILAIVYSFY